MKEKFGLKQLILLTVAVIAFELVDLAIESSTGVHLFSPRDFKELLGLIAVGLLWVWYFVDKFRRK